MADERSRPLKRSWRGKLNQSRPPDQSAYEWSRRRLRPSSEASVGWVVPPARRDGEQSAKEP